MRAGNGRNEIRTKLIRFKTEKGGQTGAIPDNPGTSDPGDVILPPDGA
ncbi:MAG: hypothetical protein KIG38_00645 [Bacteroidales bacterium]|nr:hypothetical protein [Bacteroidales bacterium]